MSIAPPPEQTRLWTSRTWPFIISTLVLMTFIAFESFAITTVLPVAMGDLGAVSWYSLAFSATIAAGLIGMVVGGNWADRSGPRRPLMVGGTLFLLGIVLCVAAPNAAVFILGRFLQGIGGGIDSVVLYVLIARQIPDGARPKMFGLFTTAWLLPSMAGPVLAGTLAELTTWRTVFALILAGSALALLGLLRTTRSDPAARRGAAPPADSGEAAGAPDREADTALTALTHIVGRKGGLAVLAAGILVALHFGAQLPRGTASIVVPLALVALLVVARSILPAGTLRLRGLPQRLVVLRAALGATVAVTDIYLTLYLQTQRGFTPTAAGMVIAVGAAGWAIGALVQSRSASTQKDHRRLILVATPLVASAPVSVMLLTLDLVPIAVVVATAILMGTGMGIASPRVATATLALARESEQGTYSSALQAGESLAVAGATAVMATILAAAPTTPDAFVTIYAVLAAGAAATILMAARTPVPRPVAAA